jgi:hypothetical protein
MNYPKGEGMPFILTRIEVGDYERWRPQFDQDAPGTRRDALACRLFRNAENGNEVFVQVEFDSVEQAKAARTRLVDSGVLDRFADRTGPTVVELVEEIRR